MLRRIRGRKPAGRWPNQRLYKGLDVTASSPLFILDSLSLAVNHARNARLDYPALNLLVAQLLEHFDAALCDRLSMANSDDLNVAEIREFAHRSHVLSHIEG